jgi:hypothetical protein
VREIALRVRFSELPRVVREAQEPHRSVDRTLAGPPEERGDRGGDPRYSVNAAGDLLDVDARITHLYRHSFLPKWLAARIATLLFRVTSPFTTFVLLSRTF